MVRVRYLLTLVYLIIVQDGKFLKFNKGEGWNKAVQVEIFQKLLLWKTLLAGNFPKLINVQDGIRVCRLDFFKKLISCAARLLDRLEYLGSITNYVYNNGERYRPDELITSGFFYVSPFLNHRW